MLDMKEPLGYKGRIPSYYPKTEEAYRHDPYEQYSTVVLRNVRNYFMSKFGNKTLEFLREILKEKEAEERCIAELGCGIAYHMGKLASLFPLDTFIGFDSSYQMLKMADELWTNQFKDSRKISLPASGQGHVDCSIVSQSLPNIFLGMSQADLLPLDDNSCDVVYSCFVWDRMVDLESFILEQKRILKTGGKLILISPLNYRIKSHWVDWYSEAVINEKICSFGFNLMENKEWTEVEEMDFRGNALHWKVVGMVWDLKE